MNYKEIYKNFILRCKSQNIPDGIYFEKHHIVPRSHGGTDCPENIVKLTFRQHIFAHKLLWKTYKKSSDLMAVMLMTGAELDVRRARQVANGKANVANGHLERIRPLANTTERQQKLAKMNREKWESGEGLKTVTKANAAWRGSHHTNDFKQKRSREYKDRFKTEKWQAFGKTLSEQGRKTRSENSSKLSEFVINVVSPQKEFLYKQSNRSKSLFVSPTGLVFESPIFAAAYFNNVVDYWTIENWCKREQHGWKRIPKPGNTNDVT